MTKNLSAKDRQVALFGGPAAYSNEAPFHPDTRYPEYPFGPIVGSGNPAYTAVRGALRLLGMDRKNFGTSHWNPLGDVIRSGDHVIVKPNFIAHSHAERREEWEHIITHPSVMRAVLDYVFIALGGSGEVTIAEGPQTDSDFEAIRLRTRLDAISTFFRSRGLKLNIVDLRQHLWQQADGITQKRVALAGDPRGYAIIDLGRHSEFDQYRLSGCFYGADYDTSETAGFHTNGRHAYVLSRTALDADVLINLPKLKTHKKTGVTLSLKNLVGIVGHRNCLPHHTIGTPDAGGDEVPTRTLRNVVQSKAINLMRAHITHHGGLGGSLPRLAIKCGRPIFGESTRVIRSGNWHGNDTAWRMVLDVDRALAYFCGRGELRASPLRYFTLVDGLIGAEGNGPVAADSKKSGLIAAGLNPVAVDTVCAEIMGFDYQRVPLLRQSWMPSEYPLVEYRPEEIVCLSNVQDWRGRFEEVRHRYLTFRPPLGWFGYVEKDKIVEAAG